jgi:hypothetical protein
MEVFGFGGIADTEYSVSVRTNYSAEYPAETGIWSTTTCCLLFPSLSVRTQLLFWFRPNRGRRQWRQPARISIDQTLVIVAVASQGPCGYPGFIGACEYNDYDSIQMCSSDENCMSMSLGFLTHVSFDTIFRNHKQAFAVLWMRYSQASCKMWDTFACATAICLTHFIIWIAVLENVPPYAGLQKRATFSTLNVGLAGTGKQTRATCVASSGVNRSAIHYASSVWACFTHDKLMEPARPIFHKECSMQSKTQDYFWTGELDLL